ncbi:MAG TPA: NADH-quinone oxidoreductase subunit J [Thermoanaerobaculia bacterium]|jgi:NADH-quinone oxidoreductase subunit J|nr:NADH-quinone oxidoreductase subunit J [Thermoanaerobaculia bacterium]HLN93251.1 NADH-quinone oxidoreductase subunit J [Thermoanaerobaculia bacterium]
MTGAETVPGALLTGAAGWAFVVFAVLALGMAVAVVVARNPIHSALFLLSSFLLVACIFVLEQAEFVGAVQILVYAGGIMVLFLFVIMLVHQRTVREMVTFQHQWDVALLFLIVFLVPFLYVLWTERFPDVALNPDAFRTVRGKIAGNTQAVAWVLYRDYLLPFEVASVFLLVAMIGAVVLGKRSAERVD